MSVAPLKILAVDDEQLLLWALKRAGKERALDICTATTTDQALAEIELFHYDLFLLDFDLNDQNRQMLLKAIDQRCPYVPIIIMTTSDTESGQLNDAIRSVRKQGAWHLLEKPFSLDRMINFVEVIFQDHCNAKLCLTDLAHNFENEKRRHHRRPHVLAVSFSLKSIIDGAQQELNATGILTDISDCGIGMLSHFPLVQDQIISFGQELKEYYGFVIWSSMIEDRTCRAGIRLCRLN